MLKDTSRSIESIESSQNRPIANRSIVATRSISGSTWRAKFMKQLSKKIPETAALNFSSCRTTSTLDTVGTGMPRPSHHQQLCRTQDHSVRSLLFADRSAWNAVQNWNDIQPPVYASLRRRSVHTAVWTVFWYFQEIIIIIIILFISDNECP